MQKRLEKGFKETLPVLWKPGSAGREEGAEGGRARDSWAGNSSVVIG